MLCPHIFGLKTFRKLLLPSSGNNIERTLEDGWAQLTSDFGFKILLDDGSIRKSSLLLSVFKPLWTSARNLDPVPTELSSFAI
jgi:hypothetical protein